MECFISYKMEGNESLKPAEFGIGLNKTFMDLKNISNINVYFNDPINDIGFMSPGVMSAITSTSKVLRSCSSQIFVN